MSGYVRYVSHVRNFLNLKIAALKKEKVEADGALNSANAALRSSSEYKAVQSANQRVMEAERGVKKISGLEKKERDLTKKASEKAEAARKKEKKVAKANAVKAKKVRRRDEKSPPRPTCQR